MPLDPQRTLLIGAPENSVRARKSNFFDALNVNEFQLIAWNAITFTQDLLVTGVTLQHPCAEGTYDQFQRRYNEKLEDILAWIKDGHVFVIFPFVFSQPFQVVGSVEWPTDINQFFPFHLANLRQAEGEFLEPDADFAATFSPFARLLKYVFVLAGENIRALFRTGSSRRERSQIAGGICPVGKGAIVFSPWPKSWTDPELVGYFEALAKIPDLLNRALDLVPEWTDAFQSERERGALTEIANLEHQIAQLKSQSDAKKSTVSSERTLKLLYSGTDNSLVVAAATAIEELGLKVVNGPRVRADLLIWDGQRRLASAEVKGLEGPARENHHRQAVRWAADVNSALTASREDRQGDPDLAQYAEKLAELGLDVSAPITEIECRGLMIIGTYRQTPLDARSGDSFPDPVIRAIARSNVCALTGLDLYCLVQQIRADPNCKAGIVDQLFSTNGVIAPADWRSVISEEHPKPAK